MSREHYKNLSLGDLSEEFEGILYIEEWRPISGYEGLYEVSSFGRVKSLRRTKNNNGIQVPVLEKIIKPSFNKGGYLRAALSKEGKSRHIFIHRLVVLAFLGESILDVNHKDVNPSNNFYKNLEYGTEKYNMQYALYVSKTKGIIDADIAADVRRMYLSGKSVDKISFELNVNEPIIATIIKGRSWSLIDDQEVVKKCKEKYCTGVSIKRPVVAISLLDGSETKFSSLSAAAISLKLHVSCISDYLKRDKRKRVGNYKFKLI